MCGIVGTLNLTKQHPIRALDLCQMLAMIRHRGPDQFGIYLDEQVGLGNARLSIIDLSTGQQPICNEDGNLWIVYNGEIFNYKELRPALEAQDHYFETNSDTEVLLHLYEEYGPACLKHLNGQYAFAIWDAREHTLFMARDRLGIRPLFYTKVQGALVFASEIKALLADKRVRAEIDPITLDQVFTYWSALSPRSIFRDIWELPPGSTLLAKEGEIKIERYWDLQFPEKGNTPNFRSQDDSKQSLPDLLSTFRELLIESTCLRLRADVPVGAYLSGGLDSSTTAAIIRNYTDNRLDTFSIAFDDPEFDESDYQQRMANFLGTDHQVVNATHADIGRVFPEVIWHTEAPILRTSPAPLFLLSKLVRDNQYKVVLTGEGADEFLAGYNIFKEAKIRRFWARQPDSQLRPLLFKRIYPYIADLSSGGGAYLAAFFGHGLSDLDAFDYSHAIRWRNTSRTKRFFSPDLKTALADKNDSSISPIPYPRDFANWHPLNQAQYIEIKVFMAQYLLSSQGDRVAMAHSVEGRFPFLDHRVVAFCTNLPPDLKLHNLNEKYLLKKLAQEWLPDEIWQRPKRPYRAPIHRSFFNSSTPNYVHELLSPGGIKQTNLFNPAAVTQLVKKIERGARISETDDMALAGILSTQLVHHHFITDFTLPPPISESDDLKICDNRNLH